MQEYSVAFGRVSRATLAANTELKSHVTDLVSRAYFNLHNAAFAHADTQWASAILASALQLCMDPRVQKLSTRELIHVFENVIRISEEHMREAKRHAAMANNVFYLKETAMDSMLSDTTVTLHRAVTTVANLQAAGRLNTVLANDA